jgi:PAS domain S-box-containing protein
VARKPRPKGPSGRRRPSAARPPESPLTPALLGSLVEDNSDAIVLLDQTGTTLYTNQTATRVLGYPVHEVIGRSAFEFVHPEDIPGAHQLFAQVLGQPGIPVTAELQCRARDGSYHILEAVGINRLGDPAVGAVVVSYRDIAERHETELRYQVLVESVNAILWRSDARTFQFDFVSREAEALLGYPAARWTTEPAFWFEHVHPDDRNWAARYCRTETDLLRPHQIEYRMIASDGRVVWLKDVIRVLAENGSPRWLVGVMLDITARKHAEQVQGATYRIAEAANTAADLPALLGDIHQIIGELMPARNFYIAVVDPATETLSFPYFVDEIDTHDQPRALGNGLTEYVLRTGQPLLATPRVYEDLVARGEVELVGAPSIDWLGVPLKVHERTIGVVVMQTYTEGVRYGEQERDILSFVSTQVAAAVERKRAEDALRHAEERYRAFIAQSTEGIWQFELEQPAPVDLPPAELAERLFRDGYLAECNDAMAQMYGFRSAREIIGARLDSLLVRSEPKNLEFLHAFVASGCRLTDVESHERDRDGHPKIFLNNMIGIIEDGRMVRAWGTQRDVTEQRRLEEQIRQAVKVEAVGRLAGGIAHDFNNILTAILGTTQLLQRELGPEAPHYADVEEIRMAAERAADLTRQLLAYSRRQVLAPRVLDLNGVVRGLDSMLRRLIGEDVDLINTLAPQLAPVRADPGQIEQVIVNLAINARDAMPDGGTLTVDTADFDVDAAFARLHAGAVAGSYVRLRVQDTGTGMDAEIRKHLFEPFFTTKPVGQGTGLGLATVFGIVKQSGGYIWAESEPGRGTVFTILLPRTSGAPEPAASTQSPAQPARGTETILLVEDEETVRTLSDRALNQLGYTVLAAPSGWDALRLAERHRGPIHLVLTDVVMPGLSGRELVRQLAAVRPGTQVLYISGYSDEAIERHGVLDPGTAFLQKPFTPDRLAAKVRAVIDAANAPPGAAKTP